MNASSVLHYIHAFSPSRRLAIVIGSTALAACLVQALPVGLAEGLNREGGLFETLSAVLLAGAAVAGVYHAWRRPSVVATAGAVLLIALLLRELDFQKRFTYRSIESIGFYTRPIASWTEKVVGLSVLSVIAGAAGVLARAAWDRLRQAQAVQQPWTGSVGAAGILLASGLVSEKFLGFTVAEEVFEAGFAAIVFALALSMARSATWTPLEQRQVPAGMVAFPSQQSTATPAAGQATVSEEPRRAA